MLSSRFILLGGTLCLLFTGASCSLLSSKTAAPVAVAPTSTPDTDRDVRLQPLIKEYLNARFGTRTHNGQVFSSYVKYGEEEKNGKLTYYIWAQSEEYYRVGDKLARTNVKNSPLTLTITKERDSDIYTKVAGHQLPDPKRNVDLKQLFPRPLVDKITALKSAEVKKRNELLVQENLTEAQKVLGMSPRFDVDEVRHEKCLDLNFQDFVAPVIQGNQAVDVVFDKESLPSLESWKSAREGVPQEHVYNRRYVVKSIGCGKKCFEHRIIDTKTNRELKYLRSQYGIDFGSNSRLLIVNPYRYILDPEPQGITTQFYVMNETDPNQPRLELKCSYTDRYKSASDSASLELITSSIPNTPNSPADESPERRYLSRKPGECATLRFVCADNEIVFTDDTGCGCEVGL